jgi:hypothetical protein
MTASTSSKTRRTTITTTALHHYQGRNFGAHRADQEWVARKVGANGVVCVGWQQVSVGKHRAGERCDVLVDTELLQFWIGNELLKTVPRRSKGQIRKKHAAGTGRRGLT